MKNLQSLPSLILLVTSVCLLSCSGETEGSEGIEDWEFLLQDHHLDKWEPFLGPEIQPGMTWDEFASLPPIGLGMDTANVFSIVDLDGDQVLRISGEYWGGISTRKMYRNYHLRLDFRWGEQKWFPRDQDSDKRDSGLLYHASGEHGEGDGFWLRSQEFQIQEGDCGDYWGIAGAGFDIPVIQSADSVYRFNSSGKMKPFHQFSPFGRYVKADSDAENEYGEWNRLDLYCYGDSSVHVVNDVVVMRLYNSVLFENDSTYQPLRRGKIQLQSESAEIFYRDIRIREIDQIPRIGGI